MEENQGTIYVIEVLQEGDNWIPVLATMDEDKADDKLKEVRSKGWDTTNSRKTESPIETPAKPYRQE